MASDMMNTTVFSIQPATFLMANTAAKTTASATTYVINESCMSVEMIVKIQRRAGTTLSDIGVTLRKQREK